MAHDARRAGEWFDREVGHRNVYIGYGDEPGAAWLVKARPVFRAYQREGYREGIDDIRYATLLKRLAVAARDSSELEIRYSGAKALQYLATLSRDSADLNTARYEMINRILQLRKLLQVAGEES